MIRYLILAKVLLVAMMTNAQIVSSDSLSNFTPGLDSLNLTKSIFHKTDTIQKILRKNPSIVKSRKFSSVLVTTPDSLQQLQKTERHLDSLRTKLQLKLDNSFGGLSPDSLLSGTVKRILRQLRS
jgi:hypothetical protein